MMTSPNTLIDTLYMYAEYHMPNDPHYLETFPEVEDQIQRLHRIVQSRTETPEVKLTTLIDFLAEWFPDSIVEDDQAKIIAHMEAAKAWIKTHKEDD